MIKVDISNIWGELSLRDLLSIESELSAAHMTVTDRNGAGSEYLGWMDLPDRAPTAEHMRILAAAHQIRQTSDVLVGVGIGGTMEQAALMAKKMTARSLDSHNADPRYRSLEEKALAAINRLGIGPAGIGGTTTALKVNIDYAPTHIAGMPAAINMCCHAARHAEKTL